MKRSSSRKNNKSKSRKSKKLAKDFLQIAVDDKIIVAKDSTILIK